MNANTVSLVPSRERGWRMGLANMLAKENGAWWRTRRWLIQCLIALLLLNGTMALNLKDGGSIDNAATGFLLIAGAVLPIAAIIMGQDSILGERHSGTAAWVLSKPLRRPGLHPVEADRLRTGLPGNVGRVPGCHCLSPTRGFWLASVVSA
jgi:hypothetical protein